MTTVVALWLSYGLVVCICCGRRSWTVCGGASSAASSTMHCERSRINLGIFCSLDKVGGGLRLAALLSLVIEDGKCSTIVKNTATLNNPQQL